MLVQTQAIKKVICMMAKLENQVIIKAGGGHDIIPREQCSRLEGNFPSL